MCTVSVELFEEKIGVVSIRKQNLCTYMFMLCEGNIVFLDKRTLNSFSNFIRDTLALIHTDTHSILSFIFGFCFIPSTFSSCHSKLLEFPTVSFHKHYILRVCVHCNGFAISFFFVFAILKISLENSYRITICSTKIRTNKQ